MGYRSTVAYTIRFTPNNQDTKQEEMKGSFELFLTQAMRHEDTAKCFDDSDSDNLSVDIDGCAINFIAEDVKWYSDYSDVKCHEDLLQMAREWVEEGNPHSQYLGYAFARVGEDSQDIVEEVGGNADYDWVSVSRQVIVDWM